MPTELMTQIPAELSRANGTAVPFADAAAVALPEATLQEWADRVTEAHGKAVSAIIAVAANSRQRKV